MIVNQNHTHSVPKPLSDEDRELLHRLGKVRDSEEARAMWYDAETLMNYPPFVDKALKLFNLKQVAHEIETSVMSKVSCTACRTGEAKMGDGESFYQALTLCFSFQVLVCCSITSSLGGTRTRLSR